MSSKPVVQHAGVRGAVAAERRLRIQATHGLQTAEFEVAEPIDEQMCYHERLRLLPTHNVVSASRRASGFNTDVNISGAGERGTICVVGPRGRMKKILTAVGHLL